MLLVITSFSMEAQLYVEKQTRHRFAQMNVGIDLKVSSSGKTAFLDNNVISTLDIDPSFSPRMIIGGTHFWGHTDIELVIPLYDPVQKNSNQEIFYTSGVETNVKVYPWRITSGKIRPYIGTGLVPYYYRQNSELIDGKGPEINLTRLPLMAGITYNRGSHMVNAGWTYNPLHKIDYYISRSQQTMVTLPHSNFSINYKFLFDTTISAEKDWESGETQRVTDILAERGKLNSWFVGLGLSSAWSLGQTDYNESNFPFIPKYSTVIMPDFTLGYYIHNWDLDFSINYRQYTSGTSVYEVAQAARRRSTALEVRKYVLDYHGFAPYIGPSVSYDLLRYREKVGEELTQNVEDNGINFGIVFGWDIRPNRLQTWVLKTNLRYYPRMNMNVDGKKVNFENIEFNFIQFVIFPGRMF